MLGRRLSIHRKADVLSLCYPYDGSRGLYCVGLQDREDNLMGKSTNGPDWTGVIAMTGAIESLHSCRVEWIVTTAGEAHNGKCSIAMKASFATLPESELPRTVTVTGAWPNTTARTFEGYVYNLLWQLDYGIQRAYEQMGLPLK
jgi:hypothetical protein